MALLYGRAGRLTVKNGGFRPGQATTDEDLRREESAARELLRKEELVVRAIAAA